MTESRSGHHLRLEGVTHHFGDFTAVRDINLDIAGGELIALLGPSGCGKSTLLRIIAGFIEQSQGSVLFDCEPVDHLVPNRRGVGIVFQNYALFPHMTVGANVAYGLEARRTAKEKIGPRVAEMLRLVHMESYAGRFPRQLSGGQQQRIALARALAVDPKILLLDEPFGALDAQTREVMHDLTLHILALEKRTIVFVTHDVEEAVYLADRVIVLAPSPGRIDSVWPISLPPALDRTQDLKRSSEFLDMERQILDRIRATSGLQKDIDALRRLTGHII